MADGTHIEWTDATWNPITGCSVVSPGCKNCYAMRLAGTRLRHHPSRAGLTVETKPAPASRPGPAPANRPGAGPVWTGEVRFNEDALRQPIGWRRPRRIFVCAHGDLFHEAAPDAWIDRVFAVMALSPQHQFQVLTKRAERMRAYIAARAVDDAEAVRVTLTAFHAKPGRWCSGIVWPLPNVWLGVSVEDQRRADERVPILLRTPAALRFISAEPLLGPVDLGRWVHEIPPDSDGGRTGHDGGLFSRLDWVIAGGESGPGARPMHPDWARSLRDRCAAAGVLFFMKQMAKKAPIPEDLMIREMPHASR